MWTVPLNCAPNRQLLAPNLFQWGGLLPPVPSSRWLGFVSAVWQRPRSYQVMWEPCHTRRKVKETGPVLLTPPGSSVWDLTHPGTAGFLKAAMQNQDPRVGIGAPSLCLFYFVLHHYLMDGRGLSSVWRGVMNYCSSSLARYHLSILHSTNIRFKRPDAFSYAPSHFPFKAFTISHI